MDSRVDGLTVENIRVRWEEIRPALAKLSERQHTDWTPEDLYSLCVSGRASLVMGADGSFAIVQQTTEPFSGELGLFILAAVGDGDRYRESLENLARELGAVFIEAYSARRGLERKGWTLNYCCYRRRL